MTQDDYSSDEDLSTSPEPDQDNIMDPEEAEETRPVVRRRHRRTLSGPAFSLHAARPKGSARGRARDLYKNSDDEDEDFKQSETARSSPLRSRDISPVMDSVRNYLTEADDLIDEVIEKLVESAENASHAVVARSKQAAHTASEMAKSGVHTAKDMAKSAQEAAKSGVHTAQEVVHHAEELAKDVYERIRCWKACHFEKLPDWMRDNEYLQFGHRPELPSFAECFKSIFRIHTETGNIWTHLIGFIAFVVATIVFYVQPLCATCSLDIDLSEKLIFLCFFIGAILCLACSTLFHTVSCHSEFVCGVFSRLDYAGIALLIVGSTIPWLYYGFYCQFYAKLIYIAGVSFFGVVTIILTMLERFNSPDYRVYRTITFVSLAFVAAVPGTHYIATKGVTNQSIAETSLYWTLTMAVLYLTGALLYAARIPERFLPGKCDIWFQSHQLFHVLVIAGAFVHYRGISEMAMYRLKQGAECTIESESAPHYYGSEVVIDPVALSGAVY